MNIEAQTTKQKEQPLRILFVHHGKGLGGAPLSLLYLIKGLRKNNHHVCVVFLHHSPALDLYKAENIEVIGPINLMDFPHTKIWWLRWYHAFTFIKSMRDTIKTVFWVAPAILARMKPDIIHLNTSSLIGWAPAARRLKIPIVWHVREPLADGYWGMRKAIITNTIKYYARAIVPISNNDAKPWTNNSKVTVVNNPVDEQQFNAAITGTLFLEQFKLPLQTPKILFLGGLSYEKGTHVIIKAFKKVLLKHPTAQLLIAGVCNTSNNRFFLTQYASPHALFQKSIASSITNLGASLQLLGPIYHVPEAIAASDVVVFPATIGHFARPIIEAGFMKKPVIASNMAPLDELIINEKTGFLVDPTDLDAWAEKLVLLLSNKNLRDQMGMENYSFCKQKFSLDMHVSKIEHIYAHLHNE